MVPPHSLIFFSISTNMKISHSSLSPATLSLVHHFLYVSFLPFHSRSLYLAQNAHFLLKNGSFITSFFSQSLHQNENLHPPSIVISVSFLFLLLLQASPNNLYYHLLHVFPWLPLQKITASSNKHAAIF